MHIVYFGVEYFPNLKFRVYSILGRFHWNNIEYSVNDFKNYFSL